MLNAQMKNYWAHACVLTLLLALLSGCSAIRIGYNQADTILAWMADDYFDFDAAQKHDFNTRIDRLLKWHRQEQLPEYAKFLSEIKQRGQRQFTRDDAAWMVDGVKARFRAIARHGAHDAAELLTTLTPDNIRALEKQYDKVNQKFAREYKLNGTPEDRKRARLERTLKQLRDWAGTLTQAQEEHITKLNDAIPSTDAMRHQDRQRRQKEFVAMLKSRHNKAVFAPQLQAWLADWEKGRAPEFDTAQNDAYEKRVSLYLEVERMLTPQQRDHVLHKLQGYIDDIHALTAKRVAEN
ncbi:MAG: DUF6279 family lipoprotein [Burkholderiales bacterium]